MALNSSSRKFTHPNLRLEETPLSTDQTLELVESDHTLCADVLDSWQLRWWLLGQGDAVVVVEPAELRAALAETLESATAVYREDQP